MSVALVLFTRDLRVHDQPALAAAAEEAEHVVPLSVLDDGILGHASPAPTGCRSSSTPWATSTRRCAAWERDWSCVEATWWAKRWRWPPR